MRIPKDFKCFVFGSADSEGVMGAFFGSADCKAVSGFWVGKRSTTEGAVCTEAELRGDGLECWGGEAGGVAGELCGQGSACLFLLPLARKQGQYTGERNKVKRIIVPSGYSNELGLGLREMTYPPGGFAVVSACIGRSHNSIDRPFLVLAGMISVPSVPRSSSSVAISRLFKGSSAT